jgi:hypothetical protein
MMAKNLMEQSIGPHEGRELELMKAGIKPLSMFIEEVPSSKAYFPENEFDQLVSEGKLVKHVSMEAITGPDGQSKSFRRILYSLPLEQWRIKSILLVQEIYSSSRSGWRPDLDRVIGGPLGYDTEDVEYFASRHEV